MKNEAKITEVGCTGRGDNMATLYERAIKPALTIATTQKTTTMKTKSVIDWSALDRLAEELPRLRVQLDRIAEETARHQVALDRFAKKVSSPFWRLLCCRWF